MTNTDTRHTISTEFFILALTITDEEFKRREKEFNDVGIKRLRASQIGYYSNIISGFNSLAYPTNPYFTVIENIEINFNEKNGILISDIDYPLNIIIFNSQIPHLKLYQIEITNNSNSLWIVNSNILELFIDNCNFHQINLQNSLFDNVQVSNKSKIDSLYFQKKVIIKSIRLNNDVKIKNLFSSESTLNGFGCELIQLESLSFTNSKIENIYFNHTVISNQADFVLSTLGNIYISEFCIITSLKLRDVTGKNIYSDYANSIGTLDVIS